MRSLGVIPARYASQRLPGKPLREIAGRPLVEHVFRATSDAQVFDDVVVATDDRRIEQAVVAFGGQVVMTRPDHITGTERVAEVAALHPDVDVVANVQGDQPFVSAEALETLMKPFVDRRDVQMSTLATSLLSEDADDPNVVKVVRGAEDMALYFSRATIPHQHGDYLAARLQHVGLYAFTRAALLELAHMPPSNLERSEGLEQLRALENGFRIVVGLMEVPMIEVNTETDLEKANQAASQ